MQIVCCVSIFETEHENRYHIKQKSLHIQMINLGIDVFDWVVFHHIEDRSLDIMLRHHCLLTYNVHIPLNQPYVAGIMFAVICLPKCFQSPKQ